MTVTRRASAITANRMSDDLYADLDHAHRRRGCFSCRNLGCLVLILLFVGVVGVFGVVAETGIIQIPVLSTAFYPAPPKPLRAVEPTGRRTIESLLQSKSDELKDLATTAQPQVVISEAELTQIVREPRLNGQVPIKQAQITIEPTFVELYGMISMPGMNTNTVVRVRLVSIANEPAALELSEIWIGYVRVPLSVAKAIVRISTGLTPPDKISGTQFGVQGIKLDRGSATLIIDRAKLLPNTK
jgi:hypothetical protein